MKKYILFFILIVSLCFPQYSYSQEVASESVAIKANVSANEFAKTYKTTSENLLYLLLSAINEHNYSIEEIQFKTGSVLFRAYTKEFIASVCTQDGYNSFIKIIPADNNYNFSPVLLEKLHSYIEMNNNISFQKIL